MIRPRPVPKMNMYAATTHAPVWIPIRDMRYAPMVMHAVPTIGKTL